MVFQITHDAMPHTLKSLGSFSACFVMASSLSSTELSKSLSVFLLKLQTTVRLMDLFGPIRGPACFSQTSFQKSYHRNFKTHTPSITPNLSDASSDM